MNRIIAFCNEIGIQPTFIQDNEAYFSARTIGEYLGYNPPLVGINNILRQHPYIKDPSLYITAKLPASNGRKYDTRLYNFAGLQLIVFGSSQPKAIDFKIAIANFLQSSVFDIFNTIQ